MVNILLVGEGNFSFSASLSNKGNNAIVATCYETEEAISKQPVSWANVKHLRSKGASVYFEVDATRLKAYDFLTSHLYDRIIFNFPHCGRKAGVKKNRDLLCRFFHSCVDVLAQDGEVHVALCQGQGGTPADHPRREWHNSWQIVSMAAKAGFILSAVTPFASDDYNGYQSTGYRSQEKSFHVNGSLNHIFTRSFPLENLPALDLMEKLTEESASLQDSSPRGLIGRGSHHPVNLLYEEMLQHIQKDLPINILQESFPVNCDRCLFCSSGHGFTEPGRTSTDHVKEGSVLEGSAWSSLCKCKSSSSVDNCTENNHGPNDLPPTWMSLILRSHTMPGTLHIVTRPVIGRCLISPWLMPVYHEVLLLLSCSSETLTKQLQLMMETIQNAVSSVQKSIFNSENKEQESTYLHLNINFHQHMDFNYDINMILGDSEKKIGTIKVIPPGEISSEVHFILTSLNFDSLTMCLLGIEDWRLLWTTDQRFLQQFHQRQLKRFKNFSLYPPFYTHDISFWVAEGLGFDELEFHTITRRVSKGCVSNIELLERYEDGKCGKTSLCYRITYQSCDCALSYESALEMQLAIRNELQKSLHITLR